MVAAGLQAWRNMRLRAGRLSDLELKRLGSWLILAPHPDDETLGAGALIAKLAKIGVSAWIVFLTDGSQSHVGAPDWGPKRIARVRSNEADRALRALGASGQNRLDLGWRDSHPHNRSEPAFKAAIERLVGLCRQKNIHAVVTTWRNEGHNDHKAAYEIGACLHRALRGQVDLFEYLVWGWTEPDLLSRIRSFDIFAFSDPGSIQRRRRAISCHRTQLSPMIADAELSFRLPREMIALAERDPSILLSAGWRHAA